MDRKTSGRDGPRRRTLRLVLVGLLVLGSGCGGDDDGPGVDASVGDGAATDAIPSDGSTGDAQVQRVCPADTVGKPCTRNGGQCGDPQDPTNGAFCLVFTGEQGICSCICTPDDPGTPTNENDCPEPALQACGEVTVEAGGSSGNANLCLLKCVPTVDQNSCPSPLVCDPSSAMVALSNDYSVCLGLACTNDSDCIVSTPTSCDPSQNDPSTGANATCGGKRCLRRGASGTTGLCTTEGTCNTGSGICLSRADKTGTFDAEAEIGDPCGGSTECGPAAYCSIEETGSGGTVFSRNGYCLSDGCAFAATIPELACPANATCFQLIFGGVCLKTCEVANAASCRGHADDQAGDYECQAWDRFANGVVASSPVCIFGDAVGCDFFAGSGLGCETLGDDSNSTNMKCRDALGSETTDPHDPDGSCADDTKSGS